MTMKRHTYIVILLLFNLMHINSQDVKKVLILGNSIVKNHPWEPLSDERISYLSGSVIDFTSKQISWILDWAVFPHDPDLCIVIGGQEDFLLGIPPGTVAENFIRVAEDLKAHGIEPVLTSVIPFSDDEKIISNIGMHNHTLKKLASERAIRFIDLTPWFTLPSGINAYNTQKAYLGVEGYAILETIIVAVSSGKPLPEVAPLPEDPFPGIASFKLQGLSEERIKRILAASPDTVKIVMLGNSITEMAGDWNDRLGMSGIRNSGQGGYSTGQMLWFIDRTVLDVQPTACFIMGGVNDITIGVPEKKIFNNIMEITQLLREQGIRPVVQSTLFQRNNPDSYSIIASLNNRLKQYCMANGIDFIDLNSQMSDEEGLIETFTTDGTHLTEEGYDVWCRILKSYLK